jgi:hypothetical protein
MDEHDRGAERARRYGARSIAGFGAGAGLGGQSQAPAARGRLAPAGRHRTVDELRRKLADGSLVPDPAGIARALLARGLP